MSLGLDLRGGMLLVYEVDTEGAVAQLMQRLERDFRKVLRDARIQYQEVAVAGHDVHVTLRDAGQQEAARKALLDYDPQLTFAADAPAGSLTVALTEAAVKERQAFAIQQNITALENRVNALGVAETVVQRQGQNRIAVQVPGVQDASEVVRLLGKVATLEFRLVDATSSPLEAERTGRAPLGTRLYKQRDGTPVLLKRDVIATGEQLIDASFVPSQGEPAVSVKLDSRGGDEMLRTTRENLNRPMAVVFIEKERELVERDGREVAVDRSKEEVISVATIRGVFSNNFQITGLSAAEGTELAKLLRAGALAAPIIIVEQRVIGPSVGQDNIEAGTRGAPDRRTRAVRLHDPVLQGVRPDRRHRAADQRDHHRRADGPPGRGADAARHRGHRADRRHGRRREHPDLRAHPRGSQERGLALGRDQRRLRQGAVGDPRLERDHVHVRRRAVPVRLGTGARLRRDADDRHHRLDVHRAGRQPRAHLAGLRTPPPHRAAGDLRTTMEFLKEVPTIRFMALRRWWYAISVAVVIASIVLVMVRGLNLTVDFTGGLVFELGFSQPVDLQEVRAALAAGGIEDFQVRTYGTASELEVRLPPAATGAAAEDARRVTEALSAIDPSVKLNRTESVGPQVSQQLGEQAALAVLMTLLLVLIYVAFRFRWRFGVGSLVASLHDPIVAVGAIALLGIPFDLNVVAALLTILGYSVNDTVVIFDRIRERFRRCARRSPRK